MSMMGIIKRVKLPLKSLVDSNKIRLLDNTHTLILFIILYYTFSEIYIYIYITFSDIYICVCTHT